MNRVGMNRACFALKQSRPHNSLGSERFPMVFVVDCTPYFFMSAAMRALMQGEDDQIEVVTLLDAIHGDDELMDHLLDHVDWELDQMGTFYDTEGDQFRQATKEAYHWAQSVLESAKKHGTVMGSRVVSINKTNKK